MPYRTKMPSAQDALQRLKEGNARFAANVRNPDPEFGHTRRVEVAMGQVPIAVILGCSDSRVPAEIIFDQGLGDLFVIRVAGNIVAPSQIDTLEYAVSQFGTRLAVVLGHSQCGAVLATVQELQQPPEKQSRNLRSIVDRIRPAVEGLMHTDLRNDMDALVEEAVRSNVRLAVNHLSTGSAAIEQLVRSGDLTVVGAEYSLKTGVIEFFDDGQPA